MSKLEVNEIDKQNGSTVTIGGSGTNVVLGTSGQTVSLGTGASQSGFGRTGTVDWQTGSIKTTTFTAANGEGYFADTSSGGFSMNLPAGTGGSIVSVADYTNTFQTGNLTIVPNGSQKIGGLAANVTLSTEGQSVTLVYVDDTEGWITVNDSSENVVGDPFIQATGGTVSCSGSCRIHTFTGPGTFAVSSAAQCAANNVVSYLVIGGGGGAGSRWHAGGGGAGGFREVKSPTTPYSASPLDGYPSAPNRITVTATSFPITVGAGGTGGPGGGGANNNGTCGNTSTFSTITAALGGKGGTYCSPGSPGGSGGGSGAQIGGSAPGGTGNTPPTTPAQGNNGGDGEAPTGGGDGAGGGGAGGAGSPHSSSASTGGAGVTTCITASPVGYAGGSGGGRSGTPGGGIPSPAWGSQATNPSGVGNNARANSGSGGGTTNCNCGPNVSGGNGGSGIVVIRYKKA